MGISTVTMVFGKRSVLLLLLVASMVCGGSSSDLITEMAYAVNESTGVTMAEVYLPVYVSPRSSCGQALRDMADSLLDPDSTWALRMVDSWGKNNDGAMYLLQSYKGSFDECITTTSSNNFFTGKYCSLQINIPHPPARARMKTQRMPRLNPALPGLRLGNDFRFGLGVPEGETKTNVPNAVHYHYDVSYATCMPSVCSKEDLEDSLEIVLDGFNMTSTITGCQVDKPDLDFTAADISFICVVSLLMLVVLAATILDITIYYSGNSTFASGPFKYLLPFSAYTNLYKMFNLNTTSSPSNITCLHGMRVLSMTWVIYCHQQGAGFVTAYSWEAMLERTGSLLFQTVLNGYPSVDTFFFLSGLLVAYSLLRQVEKSGKFNIVIFYIHRIIRLVPPIALIAWLNATVVRFYVTGPAASTWNIFQENCQKYWWRDVLFVNNLVGVTEGDCIGQTWYLAVDFQLYLVAPIIILPLLWSKATGQAWLYVVTLASFIIPASIIYARDLPPSNLLVDPKGYDFFKYVYVTPWCRAGPWVAGIWLGYILHNQGNRKVKMSPIVVVAGWTVATITGLLVVYGIWSYNTFEPQAWYDVITQVVYGSVHRTAWGAALAWIVFACHNGYGGMVDGFLSHPSWQPLSRLTYSTFLVALNIQYAIMLCSRTANYFTHLGKVIETVGAIVVSLPIAILVSLLVEAPVLGLEKLLLAPRSSGRSKTNIDKNGSPDIPLVEKPNEPMVEQTSQHPDHFTTQPQHTSQEIPKGYVNIGFITEVGGQSQKTDAKGETAESNGSAVC